jgi:hypothetical protein
LDESYGLVISNLNIQLPQSLCQRVELIAQQEDIFSIDQIELPFKDESDRL